MIDLQYVTKLYGTVIGVNDITLKLEPGAHGLLGPNGSGKSTLLNLITGQLRPTLGSLTVLGSNPRNNPDLFRRIGYCPGSEGLYSDVSAYDWVRFLQELHGMSPGDARIAAEEALDKVRMTDAMTRPISSYSRGMRQRTKMAQAIAHDPDLLILDEPFNGLDPIARHDISLMLRKWTSEGKSLIFASHVLHEVESVTDSFMLICGGRLLASGTSEEVQEMMVNVPNEISISCSDPNQMAALLVTNNVVDSVRMDGLTIHVATRESLKFFTELPDWIEETGIEIFEMHSADESLQTVFNSLMKIHRGEL